MKGKTQFEAKVFKVKDSWNLRIKTELIKNEPHDKQTYLVARVFRNDEQGNGGETFNKATYACRPPGVYHGPFKSENGCTLFELHYYKNDEEF